MYRERFLNKTADYYFDIQTLCDLLFTHNVAEIACYAAALRQPNRQQSQTQLFEINVEEAVGDAMMQLAELPADVHDASRYTVIVYLKKHAVDMLAAYPMLDDELSQKTYLALLLLSLTGYAAFADNTADSINLLNDGMETYAVATLDALVHIPAQLRERDAQRRVALRQVRRSDGKLAICYYGGGVEENAEKALDQNLNALCDKLRRAMELNDTVREALQYTIQKRESGELGEMFSMIALTDEAVTSIGELLKAYCTQ
ncbi:MAG: hypothetical protein Q4E65_06275 [Clostridia bacterium]|nr:hypothetical protein [Clostridia bacterium]